jgi:hypothetical protein
MAPCLLDTEHAIQLAALSTVAALPTSSTCSATFWHTVVLYCISFKHQVIACTQLRPPAWCCSWTCTCSCFVSCYVEVRSPAIQQSRHLAQGCGCHVTHTIPDTALAPAPAAVMCSCHRSYSLPLSLQLFFARVQRSASEEEVKTLFSHFGRVYDVVLFRAFQGAPTSRVS